MDLRTRIIPTLLLSDENLVKTVNFRRPNYIGDFINTVRIFNELEVDELCFLSIRSSINGTNPDLTILSNIADECFMPLSYGGGIKTFEMAKNIFALGFEKIVINSHSFQDFSLIQKLSEHFGSQSIVVSIDTRKNLFGKYRVYSHGGTKKQNWDPVEWSQVLEDKGAGEILLTSIDREGTWSGFDLDIVRSVTSAVGIPVIANGGCGSIDHIAQVVHDGGASAVALGSMVVFQKKGSGVLINFPDKTDLKKALHEA